MSDTVVVAKLYKKFGRPQDSWWHQIVHRGSVNHHLEQRKSDRIGHNRSFETFHPAWVERKLLSRTFSSN